MTEEGSAGNEELYEFDAPSHVVNFKQLDKSDNDDSWFDLQVSGQNAQAFTPDNRPKGAPKPRAIVTPLHAADMDAAPSTSWAAGASAHGDTRPKARASAQNQPRRVSKRLVEKSLPPTSENPKKVSKRKGERSTSPQPIKKHKKSPVVQPLRRPNSALRKSQRQRLYARTQTAARAATADSSDPEQQSARRLRRDATRPDRKNHDAADGDSASSVSGFGGFSASKPARTLKKKVADYVPMAQGIMEFERRTPERFHLRSHQKKAGGPPQAKVHNVTLTQPYSPKLMTRQRSRPTTAPSRSELEAKEVEELNKIKFKAQGLNRKILESTECLKKPEVKAPTVHEAFTMHIERRLQERQATRPEEEKPQTFKAHEVPKKILEGVVGVPERKVLQPTVPESPAFILKKKARLERKVEEVKPPSPIKAPPVPHFGLPFQPVLPSNHHTEVQPFSFEQREQEKKKLREEKLEEKQKEEVPKFKAQLLPNFDTVVLPEKKKLEPTKPEPFRLMVDERGVVKNVRWEQTMKEEQKKLKEVATFKARPNTVTSHAPFQPRKEERTPVAADSFELATERRARERQEFEQQTNEKEAYRAQVEEEQRQRKQQEEKEMIARLRQDQVHKAQPIRHYKTVEVKKSDARLTVPKSPNFSDRFRL